MKYLGAAKIKQYQTLIAKVKLERDQLTQEYRALQSKMDKANNLIKRYEDELVKLKDSSGALIVSEHAMLRYLERVYKLDLFKIESEIASQELLNKVQELGSGTYSCDESYSAKVVDGVVVTILDTQDKKAFKKKTKNRSMKIKPQTESSLKDEVAEAFNDGIYQ